ncbi:hypothetical protein NAPIS_ORF00307 [Vairimorpha apis BRL 01]|uniref:Uncharacterized protein n=1 Tax=Vairimorpha apis BRL 01 TaxID=1037528 RepID=T0L3P6_9MICR|nr:hypothetical protein NAPIS_ORF00307 [Vairimorpha apis BRL 01]
MTLFMRHHNEINSFSSPGSNVKIKYNKPNILVIDKKSKEIQIVKIRVTSIDNLQQIETEKLRKNYLLANELDLSLKHWSKTKIIQYMLIQDRHTRNLRQNLSIYPIKYVDDVKKRSDLILAENERNENLHTNFCLLNLYRKYDNTIVIKNKPYNYKNSIAYKAWGDKISDLKKKANLSHTLISLFDYKILNSVLFIHFSNFLCILLATFIRSKKIYIGLNIVNIIFKYNLLSNNYNIDCLCIIVTILIIYLKLYNWHFLVESNGESTFELSFINMLVRTLLCVTLIYEYNIISFVLLSTWFYFSMHKKFETNKFTFINTGLFCIIFLNILLIFRLEFKWRIIACLCLIIWYFILIMTTYTGIIFKKQKVWPYNLELYDVGDSDDFSDLFD